jgi:hypothetical protein
MDKGISIDEACRMRAMSPEDLSRSCNEDGSVKEQKQTTTIYLKNNETKSITVNNQLITVMSIVIALTSVLIASVLLQKKRKR